MTKKPGRTRKKRKVLGLVLLIVFALLIAVAAVALLYDARHAELEILGDKDVRLEYGEKYHDAGARAFSRGRLFGERDNVRIEVYAYIPKDVDETGVHEVKYICSYLGRTYEAERTVTVTDTVDPVLELVPSGDFNAYVDRGYIEPGYAASDNHDGDITSQVIVNISGDMVYYSVSDSSGNTVFAQREIHVAPTEPVILLNGGENITMEAAISFEDPGFRAYDGNGNNVSGLVTVEGEIIPYLTGEYELTYTLDFGYAGEDNPAEEDPDEGEESDESEANDGSGYLDGEEEPPAEEVFYPPPVTVTRTVTVVAVDMPDSVAPSEKTIYLTFDDGPGPYTEQLLDVLKKYDVKATFFVTAQNPEYINLIAREYSEGHTVAVHTYSHEIYSKDETNVYSSVEAYYADFMKMRDIIYEQTGQYTNMFRFPGGSSNTLSRFNPGIMSVLSQAMPNMGFKAFDWNVSSGDADGKRKPEQIKQNVIEGVKSISYSYAVVLQHDIKDFSVDAVEDIIIWGLSNGYTFAALDMTSPRAPHAVFN